ncbi:MAG: 50S ribosomal protein L6 [Chthoniobacterales bacterium]
MSRIGRKEIVLPEKVKLESDENGKVRVEGPKGKLEWTLPKKVKMTVADGKVSFDREGEARSVRALHGLSRSLVNNMIIGVTDGFKRNLEIQGVGFKAAVQGSKLNLSLGFSHPIHFEIPSDLTVTVTDNTKISVEGIDKQMVGQCAANIRSYYPPEPYKGKGVRYSDEVVRRKEGKKVQ